MKRATLACLIPAVAAWTPQPSLRVSRSAMRSSMDDSWPSDSSDEVTEYNGYGVEDAVILDADPEGALLQLAAYTARGEAATASERNQARSLVAQIEASASEQAVDAAAVEGTWELVFADTQLFRSSPFFMAGRAVCETPEDANKYDWFCDMHRAALAISTIERVRQVVSANQLVSEFEVRVGAVPFVNLPLMGSGGLPIAITGSLVSTADIVGRPSDGSLELLMDSVEVKGSNVPGLRALLDNGLKLDTRAVADALEDNLPKVRTPIFRTTYVDSRLRVSRDQDDKIFVYSKISSDTQPTDYSTAPADLGLSALVNGLQTAFF